MVNLPKFTMRDLVESGVHFGHKASRWNPKMAPYIYGVHNDIHIINLQNTVVLLKNALKALYDIVLKRGRVLFIGTKVQASAIIADEAVRCGQYYINNRWLGGMLTNWETISLSIKKLKEYEKLIENVDNQFTKKELLLFEKKRAKLDRSIGGICNMGGLPHALFVIDTNKEHIAIKEANKLNIPVIAVLDTNSDPAGIDYPIPGNDDAVRSIDFFCKIVSDTILEAIRSDLAKSGINVDGIKDFSVEKREDLLRANNRDHKNNKNNSTIDNAENLKEENLVGGSNNES
ncbi:ribosomal protein S2 [Ehrlichia chaffeensis str. Heartland]|uniref:Small ribosomal subunit protein uS2 n=1 Tax=Ehrlichia chaffeensis (strain ATCC CRL-10679 / Arkansas) TaxID=205920 RepID=RS2_EHRCR|nr:30S ribosomal protein S2 [Ehrlichia chaffeensis]Q2GGV4.1 RecName: Full=Small ribosomal subunit protein uS2; AltName: Full=30S ribosomal protein S2 [Ehrlichia chaffeensis str. Arkansas]ABD44907.1 ribosomal protein S2 [Ehrlichia chaffeensis str. Arkansas]AHX03608.1 ribosomal protein S2 [Ehrlichia chaffeensis str. Heartland]AHX05670.1 ribosomal protein S2 [Ehrlichia chaffeensis str. Jax]AHX06661.1 ribosomal protein S2 [Ehrlichia chaffeensis str. Liberty]AHX07315.1 ribosomal protein S2 [Ehrlic